MTVEQALTKVKEFEAEKQRLQEKKAEIEAKKSEIEEKLKGIEDEIAKLLIQQALGEFSPADEERVSALEDEAEKLERELKAIKLAVQELQRRLAQMEEDQRKVYLEFFSVRRDSLLDLVQREIEEHRKLAIELGLKGKLINQALAWLYRWETALSNDLQEAGFEPKKVFQTLGPILASRLDTRVHYFDLKTKRTDATFEEVWQTDPSIVEPWEKEGLSFLGHIPNCLNLGSPEDLRKCAWEHIKVGLGLNLDENQRKEEK